MTGFRFFTDTSVSQLNHKGYYKEPDCYDMFSFLLQQGKLLCFHFGCRKSDNLLRQMGHIPIFPKQDCSFHKKNISRKSKRNVFFPLKEVHKFEDFKTFFLIAIKILENKIYVCVILQRRVDLYSL